MVKVNNKIATAKAKPNARLGLWQCSGTHGESQDKDCHSQSRAKLPAELMARNREDNEVQLHGGSVNYLPHAARQVSLS